MVDEFTREALVMLVERSIDADTTVEVLERLVAERGVAPTFLRCDNGTELTSHALRDWCRFSRTGTAYIDPGSPWQNAYVESFNRKVRDELLDVEEFSCLAEARVVIEDWREDYHQRRPHSALGMRSPAAFAATLRTSAAGRMTPRGGGAERAAGTSPRSVCPLGALPSRASHPSPSHSWWTDKRGPVRGGLPITSCDTLVH